MPNDRPFVIVGYIGCAVGALVISLLLQRFWKGRRRPVAIVIAVLGALLALPEYLVIAKVVTTRTVPDVIGAPTFIAGMCLIVIGALIYRGLQRSGER